MVKHVVMFGLKEELELEMKQQVIETFRKGILALPATIPFIRAIEVGVNINANETWDICLNSSFDTFEEACAYGVHPAHVAVASALKPYVMQRSCVDYEVEK